MIYPFKCPACGQCYESIRHHSRSGEPQRCSSCGSWMNRVYTGTTSANVNMGKSRAAYKKAREDNLKAGGSGNIVEVGNEDHRVATPPHQNYDIPPDVLRQYTTLNELPD